MKILNIIFAATILVLASGYIMAQDQLPKWALNGQEIDFANNQANSTSQSVTTPHHASNGYYYYDENTNQNQKLFTIIDNNF